MNMKYSVVLFVVFCLQVQPLWASGLVIKSSTLPNIAMRDEILRLAQDAINTYSTWRDRANALKAHLDNAYGGRWGVILVRGSNIERVSRYDANPYFKFSIDDVYVDVFQTQLNVEKESKSSLQFPSVKLFG